MTGSPLLFKSFDLSAAGIPVADTSDRPVFLCDSNLIDHLPGIIAVVHAQQ